MFDAALFAPAAAGEGRIGLRRSTAGASLDAVTPAWCKKRRCIG
jgi:hypothetical protein